MKDFRDDADRRPQAAEVHDPLASLRAGRRRAGAARRRHPPDRRHRDALGLRGRRRHDDVRVRRPRRHARAFGAPTASSHADLLLTDPAANDPMVFCRSQATAGMSLLTRRYGIRGYATSVHTACASGGQALGTALKLIRRGAVDRVLAGGFDSMISPIGIAGFCLLSALSPDNDTPQRASRPFDATRNGFLLGEGAGFLVLEEWEAARAPRRAHLRRARRRRQFAVELPDHRFAARRRRPDPGDARGARRRRRDAGRRRLPQRARHLDRDERPQRERGDARGVRRRRRRAST